jgi:hypothetical protein
MTAGRHRSILRPESDLVKQDSGMSAIFPAPTPNAVNHSRHPHARERVERTELRLRPATSSLSDPAAAGAALDLATLRRKIPEPRHWGRIAGLTKNCKVGRICR